jgi:hypothetical protein
MTTATTDAGRDRQYCGAKKRQGEGCCMRPAGWGTSHPGTGKCKLHGGGTPNHKTAAKTEIARQAVVTYGLPREVPPDVALLEEVHRTAGHVAWLAEVVGQLEREEVTWGLAEETDAPPGESGGGGVTTKHKASVNVWVQLYQQERKHLASVCRDALAAGIAERQVRLAEAQGVLLARVVQQIVDGALEATLRTLAGFPDAMDLVRRTWPEIVSSVAPQALRAAVERGDS